MDKIQNPQISQDTLTETDVRGLELGEEEKLWKEVIIIVEVIIFQIKIRGK